MKMKYIAACMVSMTMASQAALVGYWNFDEGSGASLADSSGNGNTAAPGGTGFTFDASVPTAIGSGSSLSLNGTDGWALADDSASLSVTGDFTLSIWAKPVLGTPDITLLSKKQDTFRWDMDARNAVNGNFRNRAWVADDLDNAFTAGDVTGSVANWMHLSMVYDATAQTKTFYRNGVLTEIDASTAPLTDTIRKFSIGAFATDADVGQLIFNGLLDDAAVFSTALSASQVLSLADGSETPITVIPEPATLGLVMIAGLGLIGARRFMSIG